MKKPDITIRGTRHRTAREAIRHLAVSDEEKAILVGGMYLTVKKAEAERLELARVPFAYLFDRHGILMSVPVND
jgi:hypothetical protein